MSWIFNSAEYCGKDHNQKTERFQNAPQSAYCFHMGKGILAGIIVKHLAP